MIHYYPHVPKIGNVALSRHAQANAERDGITDAQVQQLLFVPTEKDIDEPGGTVKRQSRGICIVILRRPEPFRGAALAKTMFRIKPQEVAKK